MIYKKIGRKKSLSVPYSSLIRGHTSLHVRFFEKIARK